MTEPFPHCHSSPRFLLQDEAIAARTKIDIQSSHIDTSVFKAVLELQDVAGRDRFKDAAAIDKAVKDIRLMQQVTG